MGRPRHSQIYYQEWADRWGENGLPADTFIHFLPNGPIGLKARKWVVLI
jgi:hypothetical protein